MNKSIFMILVQISFCGVITFSLLGRYIKKREKEFLHLGLVFFSVFLGFLFYLLYAFYIQGMLLENKSLLYFLLRGLDIFLCIGIFFLFIFLSDFAKSKLKYTPLVFLHLLLTIIFIFKGRYEILKEGDGFTTLRYGWESLALGFYLIFYLGVVAKEFFFYSRLIDEEKIKRATRILSAGAVISLFSCLLMVIKTFLPYPLFLTFLSQVLGVLSFLCFYFGLLSKY